jgi:predicted extracellular nuclease
MSRRASLFLFLAIFSITLIGCSPAQPEASPTVPLTDLGPGLLISEVMAGIDGNNLFDFVELYNPTAGIIDLKGYSLWYVLNSDDEPELLHVWDESALIPPFGHYLLGQAGQDIGLPPDEAIDLALIPQRGGLILHDPTRETIDSLGWGRAPEEAVEGQPAEGLDNAVSLERSPGGTEGNYLDQDNNQLDFKINTIPSPQNTGSPRAPDNFPGLALIIDSPASAAPGTEFQIELQLDNQTGADLGPVTTELRLPAGLSLTAAGEGVTATEDLVTWTLADLADGENASQAITVAAPLSYTELSLHSNHTSAEGWPVPSFAAPATVSITGGAIPIQTARTLLNQEVVVEGIASMYTGGLFAGSGAKFYLADETGGAQVYVAGAGSTLNVAIGDRVRVQGIVTLYRGTIEIVPSNFGQVEVLAEGEEFSPLPVSIAQSISQRDTLVGQLVQLEGTIARAEEFSYSYELDLVDEEGRLLTAYMDKLTEATIETIESGQRYQVTGILEDLDTRLLLYPRQQSDLEQIYPEILQIEAHAPITVSPDETFELRLEVINHTLQPVSGAEVFLPIPPGLQIVEILDDGAVVDDQILWQIETIEPNGASHTVSLTAASAPGVEFLTWTDYRTTATQAGLEAEGETSYTFTSETLPIWAIQGPGLRSPYHQQFLQTSGVVTGVFPDLGGFWIQETETDADPATSPGLFVSTGLADIQVEVGDRVQVAGVVEEFFQQTQLTVGTAANLTVVAQGVPLPAPIPLDPPESEEESLLYFEAHEGALVTINQPAVVVDPSDRYGEFAFVLAYHQRTRLYRGEENGIILLADDGSSIVHADQSTLPVVAASGDTLIGITGPLAFTYGNFKIEPTTLPVISPAAVELPSIPPLSADQFSIMTWNVENLFDIVDPHPSSPPLPTVSEYRWQIAKVAATIEAAGLPTVVGLQEVENIGVLEDIAEHEVLQAYGYIPVLLEGDDSRGIDVGYLVRADQAGVLAQAQYPAPESITSRPPLQITIRLLGSGLEFVVINNHFTSMSGGEAATEPRRTAQAAWNAELAEEILAIDPEALLAVIGDLNSFYDSQPLEVLEQAGLIHTFDRLPAEERYTYVFEGVSQTLDHILVSPQLDLLIQSVTVLRVNADHPLASPEDFSPRHKSDHDPVIVVFSIP